MAQNHDAGVEVRPTGCFLRLFELETATVRGLVCGGIDGCAQN